ncbi:MAG TPA: hypothetical protein VF832_02550 [Longimicrobiales bacterium]
MRPLAPIRLALLATLVAAGPALAGPPWISIEYPANPYDAGTRGALLTLHTYHHGVPMDGVVSARAEGIVAGVRRTIAFTVRPTGRPGVWSVSGELPRGGTWVIASTMGEGDGKATALLALEPDGRVAGVSVPIDQRGRWQVPREATAAEIDAMLRGAIASATPPMRTGSSGGGAAGLAGMSLLCLLPVLPRLRRRQAQDPR